MQRHSGTSARGESAKLKPEKAHTHSRTTTIDAFVLFAIAISALVSLSLLLLLMVEQNKRFLSYYGIVSNMLSVSVCMYLCVYICCVCSCLSYLFFLCYFPRFCFVISFTFSRRSY